MQNVRSIGITVAVTIVVMVLLAAIFVYSGVYNVSAAVPHSGLTAYILDEASDRSIEARAGNAAGPTLDSLALLNGAARFHKLCVVCHGAPGVPRSEIAEGLNPPAPELSRWAAGALPEAQIYWIIENGIKFTGMPGFQQSQTEEQMHEIASFVKKLDHMTDAQYETWIRAVMKANGDTVPMQHMQM